MEVERYYMLEHTCEMHLATCMLCHKCQDLPPPPPKKKKRKKDAANKKLLQRVSDSLTSLTGLPGTFLPLVIRNRGVGGIGRGRNTEVLQCSFWSWIQDRQFNKKEPKISNAFKCIQYCLQVIQVSSLPKSPCFPLLGWNGETWWINLLINLFRERVKQILNAFARYMDTFQ